MHELDPGHVYWLNCYDDDAPNVFEDLAFFKRIGEGYPGNAPPAHSGTNCQEVLRALIKRVIYLNGQEACPQNIRIIECLRTSLYLFEYRAAQRKDKLTEFFQTPAVRSDLAGIEDIPSCKTCGHIFPHQHE
jgi:hypothetical protein